jgi:uncharacterized membrane protein HdeD (DUF308 family)
VTNFPILDSLTRNWWVLLIRGVLGVCFGIAAFALPGLTLVTLALVYGVYALADGLVAIWFGARSSTWWSVVFGVLGIFAGIYTLIYPGITAVVLLYFIAAWAMVRGGSEIITAIQLRKELDNEWMMILSGIISIFLGVVLFLNPAAGALAMVWLIGAYALIASAMLIVLAFKVRVIPQNLERLSQN